MYRTFMFLSLAGMIAACSAVSAQEPIPATNSAQPTATAPANTAAPNLFTQDPRPFQRGNTPVVPNEFSSVFGVSQMPVTRQGWYFDLVGLIMIIGLFYLWAQYDSLGR